LAWGTNGLRRFSGPMLLTPLLQRRGSLIGDNGTGGFGTATPDPPTRPGVGQVSMSHSRRLLRLQLGGDLRRQPGYWDQCRRQGWRRSIDRPERPGSSTEGVVLGPLPQLSSRSIQRQPTPAAARQRGGSEPESALPCGRRLAVTDSLAGPTLATVWTGATAVRQSTGLIAIGKAGCAGSGWPPYPPLRQSTPPAEAVR
jgi:hypothetical protein